MTPFAKDIFKFRVNVLLEPVAGVPLDDRSSLFQVMDWRRIDAKSVSEPTMTVTLMSRHDIQKHIWMWFLTLNPMVF